MELERRCDDFGWFSFCYVFSYPEAGIVLFTAVENTQDSRDKIKEIVNNLPDDMLFGYCNGSVSQMPAAENSKEAFLSYVQNGMDAMGPFSPCTAGLPGYARLITVGEDSAGKNENVLTHSGPSWTLTDADSESRGMLDVSDAALFLTGGSRALDNKRALLEGELTVAAGIMKERTLIVREALRNYNKEDCQGCPTEYPRVCGYNDYSGHQQEGDLYTSLGFAIGSLQSALASGTSTHAQILGSLAGTQTAYDALVQKGCE
jgi:hypothetical protein